MKYRVKGHKRFFIYKFHNACLPCKPSRVFWRKKIIKSPQIKRRGESFKAGKSAGSWIYRRITDCSVCIAACIIYIVRIADYHRSQQNRHTLIHREDQPQTVHWVHIEDGHGDPQLEGSYLRAMTKLLFHSRGALFILSSAIRFAHKSRNSIKPYRRPPRRRAGLADARGRWPESL